MKGPLGRIEVQLTLIFIPLERHLFMETLPDRIVIQPDSDHVRSTIPQALSEQRPVHLPEVSVTQTHTGNGRAFSTTPLSFSTDWEYMHAIESCNI